MSKKIILLFFILGGVIFASPVFALSNLIKSDTSSTVYYLDGNNIRHPFPTEKTYKTWYEDFSDISVLSGEEIRQYSLGKNVPVRPGVNIVTFATDANYYGVEPGGVLRLFKDQELIEEIYGPNWSQRVVELPDAFFSSYTLGEEIKISYHLPDGLVYKLTDDNRYYYKNNGIIRPFKDLNSVLENSFKEKDIIVSDSDFIRRTREIIGFDNRIFNPAAESKYNTADCENKKLKAAFIFVIKDKYDPQEIEKIILLQERLEENFEWASDGLTELDVSFPLVILKDDGYLLYQDSDGQLKPDNEVVNTFYDQHPDEFDFIILYNNFVLNEEVMARYLTVTNDFFGTGNAVMHLANKWGSQGKLKGIANMGNLNKYSVVNEYNINRSVNYIMHELLHHWSARVKFIDDQGEVNYSLLETPANIHWNMYVDFISPLGGNGWRDNGNGTFTNKITLMADSAKKPFSELDLYLMGLFPKRFVDPIRYLVPDEPGEIGNLIAGHIEEITIDQIEEAMGKLGCRIR